MANNSDRTLEDWQAMSRKYWNAWSDATRKAFGSVLPEAPATAAPWHEGLEQWSRMFAANGSQNEMVERLMAGAKSYFAMLQSLAAKSAGQGAAMDAQAWTNTLRESFNFPGADAGLIDNPLARAMREIAGQGAKGFEQMMENLAPFTKQAHALLGMPAFGYLREHQEQYQKFAQAMLDYQEQSNRYNALIARASRRGFELFEDKLAERGEPGRQIESVRALYDLWVDAAEEAYAEIALSPEFREVYGAVVNAQMRVRKHVQQEVERIATDLGMPTRSEIDSIGKRLHELRRESRSRGDIAELVAEVAALREEVERMKTAGTKSAYGASAAHPRKTAAKSVAKSSKPRKG
ncbi:MAG TPA: class III poly(R)-hydroxyalkanoic acid synthase subunit PhaE [Rhodanobacteraceae bacterium]|nr:class III poly(R)-hydroxyalkanoic acid synthase subunit PhaE [Rhodanobacteraceae bacterium]